MEGLKEKEKEPPGPGCRDYFWLVCRFVDSISKEDAKSDSVGTRSMCSCMYTTCPCTCISLYLFSPVWILRTVLILQDYFVFVLSLFYCLVFGVFWHKKYSKCLFLCWYFCYLAGQYCQSESAGQTDIAARVGPPVLWDTAWVWGGWRLDWGVEPVYCCNQAQTTIQILTWRPGKRLSLHGVIISYGRVFFQFFHYLFM